MYMKKDLALVRPSISRYRLALRTLQVNGQSATGKWVKCCRSAFFGRPAAVESVSGRFASQVGRFLQTCCVLDSHLRQFNRVVKVSAFCTIYTSTCIIRVGSSGPKNEKQPGFCIEPLFALCQIVSLLRLAQHLIVFRWLSGREAFPGAFARTGSRSDAEGNASRPGKDRNN